MQPKLKAHIGLFLTNLFFAINLSGVKYFTSNHYAGPYGLNIIRMAVSVFLFWTIFLFTGYKVRLLKKDIFRFILCSLSALAVNQMLFMKGLSLTFPIHASLLLLITPILITFCAAWMLREKITSLKIFGLIAGVTGAVILISSGRSAGNGDNIILGDILVILSAIAYTIYFILVKPLIKRYPPIDIMRWVFTFGLIMIIPLGYNEFKEITWQHFTFMDYFLIFIIAVPGTFLAYIFNVYGIKVLSASAAGAYIYLQPVFAVLIATLFLKEPVLPYKILAAILIFSGVYMTTRKVKA